MVALDWIVLGIFFLGMIGIILWVMSKKEKDTTDYFLAGKDANWLSIGSSIFSSNIGSEHLVGLAGAGFVSGMAMAHWEMQAWIVLVLGWLFVPFYDRIKVYTMPEFLERRFSKESRSILSIISLISYVLTKVAVTVYAGGVVFSTVFGIEELWGIDFFWISAIGLVVITGLYTIFGGMKAIMYTSILQTPILLIGSIAILVFGLIKVGGWVEVERIVSTNIHLIRPLSDPEFPWFGVIFGSMIIGFWYWCTDQYIVQRVLSGRNQKEARRGAIFSGYLKLLPVFIFLVPGMIAFALSQKGLITVTSSDAAFSSMVAQILPQGLTGLVVCGLLAALMSSLSSLFNSSAMLFVEDFYKKSKPNATESHYVFVSRVATTVVVVLGILWIPVMLGLGQVLYEYLQAVQGLLAPAIASVFILGVFWKRTSSKGALWGMIIGFTIGMFRLLLNVLLGAKASLVSEAEKYTQKLAHVTQSTQQLFSTGIGDLAKKIEGTLTGENAMQMKTLVSEASQKVATSISSDSVQAAQANLSQVKTTLEQGFIEQYGIFYQIASINWLNFCIILFIISLLSTVVISLLTKKPNAEQLSYTFGASTEAQRAETKASWDKWDVIHTVIIVGIILTFYIMFW